MRYSIDCLCSQNLRDVRIAFLSMRGVSEILCSNKQIHTGENTGIGNLSFFKVINELGNSNYELGSY